VSKKSKREKKTPFLLLLLLFARFAFLFGILLFSLSSICLGRIGSEKNRRREIGANEREREKERERTTNSDEKKKHKNDEREVFLRERS